MGQAAPALAPVLSVRGLFWIFCPRKVFFGFGEARTLFFLCPSRTDSDPLSFNRVSRSL